MTLTRPQFLQSTGLATLSLSLARLGFQRALAGDHRTRLEVEKIGATR